MSNPNPDQSGLRPFKKGQSGNPAGRAKKYISTLKEQGYRASEIRDTIEVMLALTEQDLEDVTENKGDHTVMEITIAKAVLKGMKDGSLASVEILLSRAYGQPKQEMDMNHGLQAEMFPDVNYEKKEDDESSGE